MNAPDYRTIYPKEGDAVPECTEYRYRDRTLYTDEFCLWGGMTAECTSTWEFRVDCNKLTPEEKVKWFPEATRDYDAITWEKWEQMTKPEKLAFNMPGFEAWAQGGEVEFQDAWSNWRPNEYPGCCCPLRPKPKATMSSIWIKEHLDFSIDVRYSPQEGYTEYRKVVQ